MCGISNSIISYFPGYHPGLEVLRIVGIVGFNISSVCLSPFQFYILFGDRTEPLGHVPPRHLPLVHIPPGHLPPGHLGALH